MKNVTLIGGVGEANEIGGELLKNKNILRRLNEIGYNVNVIDTNRSHHSIIRLIRVLIKIFVALFFRRKDVFILSSSFFNYYSLLKAIYFLPIHYDIVNWIIGRSLNILVENNAVKKKYLDNVRLHIVEAGGMKKELVESLGIPNIEVLYNFRELKTLPSINKYEDGKIHFLFFSRITPQKGVDDIFAAVSILEEEGYSGKFCIDFYGDVLPSYKEEFAKKINSHNNISFCRTIQLHNWENYQILSRYHYMLFPTYWHGEGFPGAIIDSYIAGVPILASDWAYVPEFIEEGKSGRIYPAHNVEALASVMMEAIDGKMDCAEMSRNCQRKAYEFDTKYVLNESILNVILNPEK